MSLHISLVGGSGFIGTELAEILIKKKYSVKIIDKEKSASYPELSVYGDVQSVDSLRSTMQGSDVIYNLSAEHRDNVNPVSLYSEVNVEGAKNICNVAEEYGINKIIFTSTVAVYGFTETDTDETGKLTPFNEYGRSKLAAEKIYENWVYQDRKRTLVIVRPTVVFGEGNRGNVYNLIKQIVTRHFIMIGNGKNIKSMAYVKNVATFLEFVLQLNNGIHVFNYADKPDFDMNTLVSTVNRLLGKNGNMSTHIPFWVGYLAGIAFDKLSLLTKRDYKISAIRIKKFCSNTIFSSSKISKIGFIPTYTLYEGLEKTIKKEFSQFISG